METVIQTVWTKARILVKALIIGGIVLILQIPTFYVQDLVKEREDRQKEAITEVSSKWATKQTITGPVLVLPFLQAAADSTTITKRKKYFVCDFILRIKKMKQWGLVTRVLHQVRVTVYFG